MKIETCQSCGGRVEFSPKDKALKCIKCGNLYPINYTKEQAKHPIEWVPDNVKLEEWANSNKTYKCKLCGAQVTFNRYDVSTSCKYCNNDTLLSLKELPGLLPEKIIPFEIDKKQAKLEFETRIKQRKFLPSAFKKNLPNYEINSTYLSAFSFDGFVSATYSGRERLTKTERDSQGRSRTVVYYRNFSGRIDRQFVDVVVEASDKIAQEQIRDVLPYDFSQCYDYDNDFIKGYSVGYYNQSIESSESVAKQEMLRAIDKQIRQKYSSVDSLKINPTYSNIKYNYTLLPMYFVDFSYKNKKYLNVMNGQTGAISGGVPRSGLKITLFVLALLILIGVPVLAVLLMM